MGVYWKWVCRARMEEIDPDSFDEGVKHPELAVKTMTAVAHLLTLGTWRGHDVRLINDSEDQHEFYEVEYRDVSVYAKDLVREALR